MTVTAAMEARALRAGPVSLLFDNGALVYVRLGDREILRKVYLAVRDPRWATMPATISEIAIDENAAGFRVGYTLSCQHGDAAFRWRVRLEGDARGTITLAADGEALTAFQANRIGLCVLHPVEECRARPCDCELVDGAQVAGRFPDTIHPFVPFNNLRALAWDAAPGVRATLRLEGDTFETEDQRQWGDASFKTYSRPVVLPAPFDVPAGTRYQQSLRLSFASQSQAPIDTAPVPVLPAQPLTLVVDTLFPRRLPRLGVTLARGVHGERERALMRTLGFSFARAVVDAHEPELAAAIAGAAVEARALAVGLDLAVFMSPAPGTDLRRLADAVVPVADVLRRVTLLTRGEPVLGRPAIAAAQEALAAAAPSARVGASAYPYFAELNRNRRLVAGLDFLSFTFEPQVHADDDRTIAENAVSPRWMAETARAFAPAGMPLVMAPVAFKTVPPPSAETAAVPAHADARQFSRFAAGWLAAHLAASAEAGLEAVAYFETRGALGFIAGDESALPAGWPPAGSVYPLYHVLADIAEFENAEVLPVHVREPGAVGALVLRKGERVRALVANLSRVERAIAFQGLPTRGARVRRLDATAETVALREPDAFRARAGVPVESDRLVLGAHEILRVDIDLAP